MNNNVIINFKNLLDNEVSCLVYIRTKNILDTFFQPTALNLIPSLSYSMQTTLRTKL